MVTSICKRLRARLICEQIAMWIFVTLVLHGTIVDENTRVHWQLGSAFFTFQDGSTSMHTTQFDANVPDVMLSEDIDLSSVACRAAIELDDLLIGRSEGVEAVRHLGSIISRSIPPEKDSTSPNWLLDPSAFVIVNRAIHNAQSEKALGTVEGLVREAGEIVQRFEQLARNPTQFKDSRNAEVAEMRAFCLALSRSASASKKSPIEWTPKHPFRR